MDWAWTKYWPNNQAQVHELIYSLVWHIRLALSLTYKWLTMGKWRLGYLVKCKDECRFDAWDVFNLYILLCTLVSSSYNLYTTMSRWYARWHANDVVLLLQILHYYDKVLACDVKMLACDDKVLACDVMHDVLRCFLSLHIFNLRKCF